MNFALVTAEPQSKQSQPSHHTLQTAALFRHFPWLGVDSDNPGWDCDLSGLYVLLTCSNLNSTVKIETQGHHIPAVVLILIAFRANSK